MPPAELKLAWFCERWNALPNEGGVNSQDYAVMHRMSVLSNVYSTVSHYRNLTGNRIHTLSDGQRRLIKSLKDMGIFSG